MPKCTHCKKKITQNSINCGLAICKYCPKTNKKTPIFCDICRLPEQHKCEGLDILKQQQFNENKTKNENNLANPDNNKLKNKL